jgi:hypothetical protein
LNGDAESKEEQAARLQEEDSLGLRRRANFNLLRDQLLRMQNTSR